MNDKIFGYTWESIQARQQGTYKPELVPNTITKPQATEEDIKQLKTIGLSGLKTKGFFGIIDRLTNSNLIGVGK